MHERKEEKVKKNSCPWVHVQLLVFLIKYQSVTVAANDVKKSKCLPKIRNKEKWNQNCNSSIFLPIKMSEIWTLPNRNGGVTFGKYTIK